MIECPFLDIHEVGEQETFGRPGLTDDLSLKPEPSDGDVFGPISAKALVFEDVWMPPRDSLSWRAVSSLDRAEIAFYLTESRLAYICANYGKRRVRVRGSTSVGDVIGARKASKTVKNTALAGQLRFPWIKHWEWFGTSLRIFAEEQENTNWPEPVRWPLSITIELRRREDVLAASDVLMTRILAYRLVDSSPKDESTMHQLRDLLHGRTVLAPRPQRVEDFCGLENSRKFGIPGCMPWGHGAGYVPPAPPSQLLEADS